jgi:hypothetical protein
LAGANLPQGERAYIEQFLESRPVVISRINRGTAITPAGLNPGVEFRVTSAGSISKSTLFSSARKPENQALRSTS